MSGQEDIEYAKWIDARTRLISALESFKKAVDLTERDLQEELQEAIDETDLEIEIGEDGR